MRGERDIWHKKIYYTYHFYPLAAHNGSIYCGDVNGNIYQRPGNIETPGWCRNIGVREKITTINFFGDDVMIIGTLKGSIFRSEPPYTTFTKVLQMTGILAWPRTWSVAGDDTIIFVGEYGSKDMGPQYNGRRVYKSIDNGVTWQQCWISPFENGSHIHKLLLDPVSKDLYVCTGDGVDYARVFKLSPPNYDTGNVVATGIQPTGGLMFDDFILWVQDSGPYGIYKQDKSTYSLELVFDLSQYPDYSDTGFDGLALSPDGIVYYATYPSVDANNKKIGLFRSKPPYADWELLSTIDEFVGKGVSDAGVFTIVSASDDEVLGHLCRSYGYVEEIICPIKFIYYLKDLRT